MLPVATVCVLVVAGAVAGLLLGGVVGDRDLPAGRPAPRPRSIAHGGLRLQVPSGWTRGGAAAVPGFHRPLGLRYADAGLSAAVERLPPTSATLLPVALSPLLKAAPQRPAEIRLASGQRAWRYRLQRSDGSLLVLYALPTTGGVATVACASPAVAAVPRACDALAAAVAVPGWQPLKPGNGAAFFSWLPATVAELEAARAAGGSELAAATRAAAQAAGRGRTGPRAPGRRRGALPARRRADPDRRRRRPQRDGDAYTALARAARARVPRRYAAASRAVRAADARAAPRRWPGRRHAASAASQTARCRPLAAPPGERADWLRRRSSCSRCWARYPAARSSWTPPAGWNRLATADEGHPRFERYVRRWRDWSRRRTRAVDPGMLLAARRRREAPRGAGRSQLPRPARRSRSARLAPCFVLAVAIASWSAALSAADLSRLSGYGLLSALPPAYYLALVLVDLGLRPRGVAAAGAAAGARRPRRGARGHAARDHRDPLPRAALRLDLQAPRRHRLHRGPRPVRPLDRHLPELAGLLRAQRVVQQVDGAGADRLCGLGTAVLRARERRGGRVRAAGRDARREAGVDRGVDLRRCELDRSGLPGTAGLRLRPRPGGHRPDHPLRPSAGSPAHRARPTVRASDRAGAADRSARSPRLRGRPAAVPGCRRAPQPSSAGSARWR